MEIANIVIIICTNLLILKFLGFWVLFYCFMSWVAALNLTPTALHIIGEHYEYYDGPETYNYYGPFNYFHFNSGHHIEHHDFPNVPWYNMSKIKYIAPEFY